MEKKDDTEIISDDEMMNFIARCQEKRQGSHFKTDRSI